jgi:hypothetical protein
MAIYTRYARVLDAEGKPITVREALALINQTSTRPWPHRKGILMLIAALHYPGLSKQDLKKANMA